MFYFGIMAFSKSPLARMLAVLLIEYLIRKGFIAQEDLSQAVDDAVNIIGFVAMTLTLLIWQWRTHHPAKAHLDVEMPTTVQDQVQIDQTTTAAKLSLNQLLKKLAGIFTTPKTPVPPQQ